MHGVLFSRLVCMELSLSLEFWMFVLVMCLEFAWSNLYIAESMKLFLSLSLHSGVVFAWKGGYLCLEAFVCMGSVLAVGLFWHG